MVMSKENYEDLRNKRLEENKKKIKELNLPLLALKLRTAHSPKPTPMKHAKPRVIGTEAIEVRRSSRVASLPAPDHKEIVVYERVTVLESGRKYSYLRKRLGNRDASDEARYWATTKAEEFEASLEGGYPSFVKPILRSHAPGSWLRLPAHFCRENLPKNDAIVTLIDEEGGEVPTMYLASNSGLNSGWRGFSISHELVDGDALVFQLVELTVFKVYIIRCKGYEEGENNEALEA